MFKNYLTTALRNLLRHKLYSVINIGGLAIGLAACILILLFVQDELSYDDWIPDAERVFKIELTIPIPGRETLMLGQVPPGIAPVMEHYFPDHIEDSTRVLQVESIIGADERYFNDVISYVDDGFFNVFDLEIVAGSRDPIATSVRDILISETVAHKHFGEQNPVGRVVSATVMRNFFSNMNPNSEYRVAGVFRDIPSNSHLPFQALALLDPDRFEGINEGFGGAWLDAAYFKFFPGVDPLELESRLGGFYSNVAPPRGDESEAYDYRVDRKFNFINVADVHLHSDKIQQLKPIGDFNTVISFAIAAVLILVIAAINFMNLTTARALRRAKEVSLRKVLGASRRQLVRQFMGEAVLTSLAGLTVALIVVESILPWFNQYLDKAMQLDVVGNPLQTGGIVIATMLVGALGGVYPAFFLSSYRPAHVMGSSTSANKGSPRMRQVLVVLQFAISIFLIVATAIVYQQTLLLRDMELGIEKDHKLAITGLSADAVEPLEGTIRQEMLNIPGVTAAALSSDELPLVFYNSMDIEIPALGVTEGIDTDRIFVDAHFLDLFGVKPLAGRVFGEEFTADGLVKSSEEGVPWTRNAVVTETFVRVAGLSRPEDLLGQILVAPDFGGDSVDLHATVIGVVPDLHLRALRERTEQMAFFTTDVVLDIMTLKIESNDLPATLAEIDRVWQDVVPQVPIQRYFVDDKYAALYDPEERRSQVFAAFTVFAVLVACLGLFGLSAYSAEQRTLEIGIRKVLGARISDILALIGAQFMKSVLWANVIAWPMVYLVMRDWLDAYEFRIDIDPLIFIACGLLTLVLAWLTIGWQVLKVARANPIRALRYE
jgi:putative ABC transport system permease protein